MFGDKGAFRGGEHPSRFHGVRWLSDTAFYRDFVEIVAEKARYYWWGQQITLGMLSWSQFVAIEGQRRNIPYLWAFMALAQLVSLSYAQNLFFVCDRSAIHVGFANSYVGHIVTYSSAST